MGRSAAPQGPCCRVDGCTRYMRCLTCWPMVNNGGVSLSALRPRGLCLSWCDRGSAGGSADSESGSLLPACPSPLPSPAGTGPLSETPSQVQVWTASPGLVSGVRSRSRASESAPGRGFARQRPEGGCAALLRRGQPTAAVSLWASHYGIQVSILPTTESQAWLRVVCVACSGYRDG